MLEPSRSCVIIGIAGASASGKSLIAQTIYHELIAELDAAEIGVISEDCYYRDQSELTMEERLKTNYDHPKALDHALLAAQLQRLRQGQSVDIPQYSYVAHTRTSETIRFAPKKVIILEGILLLTDARLRELMDATIFMDTPLDICLIRRLQRDVEERGRSMESVLQQYRETVRPMFLRFIEPSKQYADIIVPRGGKNRIATDMIKSRIRHLLMD
ncbi:uridine kinase [Zobellella aerophila]|uniref:Uridine kinase n=1 Tax=Zobellella aerophila TaxID=870480 RepID=A0ABP6V6I4_9GAMM